MQLHVAMLSDDVMKITRRKVNALTFQHTIYIVYTKGKNTSQSVLQLQYVNCCSKSLIPRSIPLCNSNGIQAEWPLINTLSPPLNEVGLCTRAVEPQQVAANVTDICTF